MNGKGPNLIVGIAELLGTMVITTTWILWTRLKLIPYITGRGKLLPQRILAYSCPSSEMSGTGLRGLGIPHFRNSPPLVWDGTGNDLQAQQVTRKLCSSIYK